MPLWPTLLIITILSSYIDNAERSLFRNLHAANAAALRFLYKLTSLRLV